LWDDVFGGDWPAGGVNGPTGEQILQAIREGGLVGMGGAGFPTHVKLKPNPAKPVDTLLVNGCECEPYLTADYRLMLEAPKPIITGALLAAKAAGAERIIVAIEDNKPDAIAAMRAAANGTGIEVVAVHTKYPMGGERQLVVAALGRVVPTGGLPLDCGVVVVNVATAAAIARAVLRGKPLTHRVITVSGNGVNRPCNLLCAVGVSYRQLVNIAGGLTDQAVRVVAGGPMMGFAVSDLDEPVIKGTSGITVLTRQDVESAEETPCIRCGRCADVCPLRLVPTRIALAARNKDWELATRYYMAACVECGCCAYACPARIPLVQIIRAGKATVPK
jgi:electron transport complex protein RnfC